MLRYQVSSWFWGVILTVSTTPMVIPSSQTSSISGSVTPNCRCVYTPKCEDVPGCTGGNADVCTSDGAAKTDHCIDFGNICGGATGCSGIKGPDGTR